MKFEFRSQSFKKNLCLSAFEQTNPGLNLVHVIHLTNLDGENNDHQDSATLLIYNLTSRLFCKRKLFFAFTFFDRKTSRY